MKYAVDIQSQGRGGQVLIRSAESPNMALEKGYKTIKPSGVQWIAYVCNDRGDVWRYWVRQSRNGLIVMQKKTSYGFYNSDQLDEIDMGVRRIHRDF